VFHILTLTYTQPLDAVAAARPDHVTWMNREVDAGRLIMAGRLEADRGGLLITADMGIDEAEQLMADDPYTLAGLVSYDRSSFEATVRPPGL
jgi:uncharacterized protein